MGWRLVLARLQSYSCTLSMLPFKHINVLSFGPEFLYVFHYLDKTNLIMALRLNLCLQFPSPPQVLAVGPSTSSNPILGLSGMPVSPGNQIDYY